MNRGNIFIHLSAILCALFLTACAGTKTPQDCCTRIIDTAPVVGLESFPAAAKASSDGEMIYADASRLGKIPYSKDPHVIYFGGRYLMYFSIPPYADSKNPVKGWGIGIAESSNLRNWRKIGELVPEAECESKGLCAPGAIVRDGVVHLFYQTYGNGAKDAICHAWSSDGVNFVRDPSNPVFSPDGKWNNGRAIDAEVVLFKDRYFLYYATRDTEGKVQMQGVATTDADSTFARGTWENQSKVAPMLRPELDWETNCIEAASAIVHNDKVYVFYAGGYNNDPQQIGVAISNDGINFQRLSDTPLLPNGKAGEWNSSESGHPHIFAAPNGKTYLFFQGNDNKGKNWFLSNKEIKWIKDYLNYTPDQPIL